MLSLYGKPSDNLILLALASFAFMSIFGIGIGMGTEDGQMSTCPFIGAAAICQMNVAEHIAQWQQAFLGMPTKANLLALAIVLFAVVIIPFVKPFSKLKELAESAARFFAYRKTHLIKVFDPLVLAFADGILNPKIY